MGPWAVALLAGIAMMVATGCGADDGDGQAGGGLTATATSEQPVGRAKSKSGRTPLRPLPAAPPEPDRSGTKLEAGISARIAAGSTAPNAVKVRCPKRTATPHSKLRCTGTRRHDGRLYRYTIGVNFSARGIRSLEIDSPDDRTGTIVESEKR